MKYLKRYESFEQPEGVKYFMDIIRDKVLELDDDGFNVKVEDNTNEPLLEQMIRITIRRKNGKLYSFSDCKESITDILLTNKELNCFKRYILLNALDTKNSYGTSSLNYCNLTYNFDTDKYHEEFKKDEIGEIDNIKYTELFFE